VGVFYKFSGDDARARMLTRRAEKYLGVLEGRMKTQGQTQGRWQVTEHDGTHFDLVSTPFSRVAHIYSPPAHPDLRATTLEIGVVDPKAPPLDAPDSVKLMWIGARYGITEEVVTFIENVSSEADFIGADPLTLEAPNPVKTPVLATVPRANIVLFEPGYRGGYVETQATFDPQRSPLSSVYRNSTQVLAAWPHMLYSSYQKHSVSYSNGPGVRIYEFTTPPTRLGSTLILANSSANGIYSFTVPWDYREEGSIATPDTPDRLWNASACVTTDDVAKEVTGPIAVYPGTYGGLPTYNRIDHMQGAHIKARDSNASSRYPEYPVMGFDEDLSLRYNRGAYPGDAYEGAESCYLIGQPTQRQHWHLITSIHDFDSHRRSTRTHTFDWEDPLYTSTHRQNGKILQGVYEAKLAVGDPRITSAYTEIHIVSKNGRTQMFGVDWSRDWAPFDPEDERSSILAQGVQRQQYDSLGPTYNAQCWFEGGLLIDPIGNVVIQEDIGPQAIVRAVDSLRPAAVFTY
jgi:hypothetical protein